MYQYLADICSVLFIFVRPKTSKTASILKCIETNKVKREHYLMRQNNTIYFV